MFSDLSQERSSTQRSALPTSREISSIPRGDVDSNWEYPSPQQMFNAMLRKGYDKTPEDAVEAMVAVHNFLNEGAWQEIEGWESRFSGGLMKGWGACRRGEEGYEAWKSVTEGRAEEGRPKLARFMGRPGDWTPKARMLGFVGGLWPSQFPYVFSFSGFDSIFPFGDTRADTVSHRYQEPFDRHDWFVLRQTPDGETKQVRYVIDYYSGESSLNGEEVFYLDVRPAIDTPMAAVERLMRYGGDIWYRAMGTKAREMLK